MEISMKFENFHLRSQSGRVPLVLLWLLGVPIPVLILIFLFRGCFGG